MDVNGSVGIGGRMCDVCQSARSPGHGGLQEGESVIRSDHLDQHAVEHQETSETTMASNDMKRTLTAQTIIIRPIRPPISNPSPHSPQPSLALRLRSSRLRLRLLRRHRHPALLPSHSPKHWSRQERLTSLHCRLRGGGGGRITGSAARPRDRSARTPRGT